MVVPPTLLIIGEIIAKNNLNIVDFYAKPLKIFFSKTTEQNSLILHMNNPWVSVIKVCSNGGATYIIREIIAKNNLNIVNLMQNI